MGAKQGTRHAIGMAATSLRVRVRRLGLPVANPLHGQSLAVPRDVGLGDTPEGDPAIHWQEPPPLDELGIVLDWKAGGSPEQALWAFVELAHEARPERFLAFARRFGVLGLWPYRTPTGHKVAGLDYRVPSIPEGIWTPYRYATFEGRDAGKYWEIREAGLLATRYEPIAEWRRWARWFRAVLRIGFELKADRPGRRAEWAALDWDFWFDPAIVADVAQATDLTAQRRELARVIQGRFLSWSGLVPRLDWEGREPTLGLALGGWEPMVRRRTSLQQDWPENCLYPALVAQLIALLLAGGPASCSKCGRLHPRVRKPRSDQPAYCPSCRLEAQRQSKKEWAARHRAALRGAALTATDSNADSNAGGPGRTAANGGSRNTAYGREE